MSTAGLGHATCWLPCWHPTTASRHRKRLRLQTITDEVFVDFPAGTTGRIQVDRAFTAAGLERTVAFEVTDPTVMARLVSEGLGIALLASSYAVRLPGVAVVSIVNPAHRVEHLIGVDRDQRRPQTPSWPA